jgi:flavin reductase (DIM6/NTAB) family NADH-FMN oxidoreductase RutF
MNAAGPPSLDISDSALLRRVFATFATGVTVLTVGGEVPHGMTANSFTSVSLDPPLVLVCIGRDAIMHRSLRSARSFAVSVLGSQQEAVARHFANRRRELGKAQFDQVDWRPGPLTGAPLIKDALAHFECAVWRAYDGGDHTIFVGKLLAMRQQQGDDALLFFSGRFRQLHPGLSRVTA